MMVTFLRSSRSLSFFLIATKVLSGRESETPGLYGLARQFVEAVDKGEMKKLPLDRGFLDKQVYIKYDI